LYYTYNENEPACYPFVCTRRGASVGTLRPPTEPGEGWLIGYTGVRQPGRWRLSRLTPGARYHLRQVDPWAMTITPIDQPIDADEAGRAELPMPGKPRRAFILTRQS